MAVKVTGPGPSELKILGAKLKTADPALKRDLRRNFRGIATPIVAEVRACDPVDAVPPRRDPARGDRPDRVVVGGRVPVGGAAGDRLRRAEDAGGEDRTARGHEPGHGLGASGVRPGGTGEGGTGGSQGVRPGEP